jgi:hypothetical protein
VVGRATGYELGDPEVGVRDPVGVKDFLLNTSSRPILRPTQPPTKWKKGWPFPGGKVAGA